jgi:hypothetical protein
MKNREVGSEATAPERIGGECGEKSDKQVSTLWHKEEARNVHKFIIDVPGEWARRRLDWSW